MFGLEENSGQGNAVRWKEDTDGLLVEDVSPSILGKTVSRTTSAHRGGKVQVKYDEWLADFLRDKREVSSTPQLLEALLDSFLRCAEG